MSLKATNLAQMAILSMVRAKKEELMKEVYTIMTATLGVPPAANKKFVFDYYDKDGKPGRWEGTPIEFYKVRCTRQDLFAFKSHNKGTRTLPLESTPPRTHSPSSMTRETSMANFTLLTDLEMSGEGVLSYVRHFIYLSQGEVDQPPP